MQVCLKNNTQKQNESSHDAMYINTCVENRDLPSED